MGESDTTGQIKQYTTLFCQSKLSFGKSCAFVFMSFYAVGLVQGYYSSISFILSSEGASLSDQSHLSFASYPYSYKFLISPLLDRYFFRSFGRSKTYCVAAGSILASLFSFLGPTMANFIENVKVGPLIFLFLGINMLVILLQVSSESWILGNFKKEEKAKASLVINLGQVFGIMCGYNFFTPLNDVDFLNEHFFKNHPRTTPLVTHTMFMFFAAAIMIMVVLVNILLVSEEKILDTRTNSLCTILGVIPKSFMNRNLRNFILYMFGTRFIFYMSDSSLDFALLRNGYLNIDRSILSGMDTLMYPIAVTVNCLAIKFIKKGNIIKVYHWIMVMITLIGLFRYLNYRNLVANQNYTQTVIFMACSSFFRCFDLGTTFLFGYFNTIIDKTFGNTSITILTALMNQTSILPTTIGLGLAGSMNYDLFITIVLIGQGAMLLLLWPFAAVLDKRDQTE